LDEAAKVGTQEVVMGMAHRGRLNVLANIVGKSYQEIFGEFEGNLDPESVQGSGDVKYHKGAVGKFTGRSGIDLTITMASNPSHLEAVDPVVEGMARAKQDRVLPPTDGTPAALAQEQMTFPVLSLLVHGDAAFAGQGVVAETLNLSQLSGYRTGGTVHLVINNQVGFTTAPQAARSSMYATDVAKMVQAPIFHVNGDDPEACMRAARLAFAFRQRFHKDVVIDLVCYRRHGHNEGDDPSYTQPLMYQLIDAKRSVRKLYTEVLVRRGDITLDEAEAALDSFNGRLQQALDEVRAEAVSPPVAIPLHEPAAAIPAVPTGVPEDVLVRLAQLVRTVPEGFTIHPKLERQFAQRDKLVGSGQVDWALGEALAVGSLLLEGADVRLTGQDTRRGTFSHRHSVLVDYANGNEYVPLAHVGSVIEGAERLGHFTVRDSLLSEYAAVGFEYGYSVEAPDSLVAWEAQFGDFVNGAEIIIDNFLVAAEDKWGQRAGLAMLLPHGYEGQGPEHSSASASCRSAPGATCASPSPRPPRSTSTCCAPRCSARPRRRSSSSRRSRCCGLPPRARPCPSSPPVASPRCSTTRASGTRAAWSASSSPRARWPSRRSPAGTTSWPTPPTRWRASTPSTRRPSPWCASSSSTRGPSRGSPRCSGATRSPATSSGSKRSPRTWAPGRSCSRACTACHASATSSGT
jgi:2-oxoglutarate dehydrogenase E1 component